MTQAVIVRRDGDTFQARLFWRNAARLLDPESGIARVGFESGPRGFDDVWIEYASPLLDHEGRPLRREHLQCKWHVAPSTYGYASLSDPEFINAASTSLLSRALAAQRAYAPDGEGARFRLVTNYRIDRADPLRALVNQRSHALRLHNLFSGGDRSATGKVRKHWRDHLDIDDVALRTLARTLAFSEATDSLDDLRDTIDPYLRIAGLRRIPRDESAFIYDDLVYQWAGQGRLEFDRDSFHAACESEKLFAGAGDEGRKVYGVKSFEHATDRLEDQCAAVLDLVPEFEARQIRPNSDWQTVLYPALRKFLLDAAKGTDALRLILDAHLTLSFAAGSILDIKSGRPIELIQRTIGKSIWSADDAPPDPTWPGWSFAIADGDADQRDIAVAVGLTHRIGADVASYVSRALPGARLLSAELSTGPGARSVACGRHAFDLAETLTQKIRAERPEGGRLHLFIAGPGAFAFFLGQRHAALGALTLYEFDFEGMAGGSYAASLSLPIRDT